MSTPPSSARALADHVIKKAMEALEQHHAALVPPAQKGLWEKTLKRALKDLHHVADGTHPESPGKKTKNLYVSGVL